MTNTERNNRLMSRLLYWEDKEPSDHLERLISALGLYSSYTGDPKPCTQLVLIQKLKGLIHRIESGKLESPAHERSIIKHARACIKQYANLPSSNKKLHEEYVKQGEPESRLQLLQRIKELEKQVSKIPPSPSEKLSKHTRRCLQDLKTALAATIECECVDLYNVLSKDRIRILKSDLTYLLNRADQFEERT